MGEHTGHGTLHRLTAAALLAGAFLTVAGKVGAAPPLRILYAGSLVALMEHDLGPAFTKADGVPVQGRAGGSIALAHMILDGLQSPDLFVSADPAVNKLLFRPGPAPSASWFLTFARTTMVVAYSPRSRFAGAFRDAASGQRVWYDVLSSPGLRLGRTDPRLDPKGYRTILVLQLAERYYHRPGLEARLLGAAENPAQTFPEEALVGRLESGQLDAGFFYLTEVTEQRLPYVTLPDAVNLGNPSMARSYAEVAYTDSKGEIHRGAPILYTVTIPSTVQNFSAAVQFIEFLYGPAGRGILESHGLLPSRILVGGDSRAVPPPLRRLAQGTYEG
ncbi:MAG TPA: extracellular solute-binding protein [bacterium]|nr:extracellular solute-binding protein [bacterium]